MNRCRICHGRCCTYVNDVNNILVERGELDPDAEVNIIVLCVVLIVCVCCRVSVELSWIFVSSWKT